MTRIGKVSKDTFATLVELVPILRDLWGGGARGGGFSILNFTI